MGISHEQDCLSDWVPRQPPPQRLTERTDRLISLYNVAWRAISSSSSSVSASHSSSAASSRFFT